MSDLNKDDMFWIVLLVMAAGINLIAMLLPPCGIVSILNGIVLIACLVVLYKPLNNRH